MTIPSTAPASAPESATAASSTPTSTLSLGRVLDDEAAIGDRQATDALLLTYNADLSFFEARALGRLRAAGARVTVIADANVWDPDTRGFAAVGRQYHLGLVDVRAAFHPKVLLLAGRSRAIAAVGSGNLTFGGWQYNSELLTVFRADRTTTGPPTTPSPAITDITDIVEHLANTGALDPLAEHGARAAVAATRSLLEHGHQPTNPPHASAASAAHRAVSTLTGPLIDHLPNHATGDRTVDLRLSAPFHDHRCAAVAALLTRLQPTGTVSIAVQPHATSLDLVALRRVLDNHQRTAPTPPKAIEVVLDGHSDPVTGEPGRYRHGKLIEWTDPTGQAWAMTGSPNLSQAALLHTSALIVDGERTHRGNVEVAVHGPIPETLFETAGPLPQSCEPHVRLTNDTTPDTTPSPGAHLTIAAAFLAGPWNPHPHEPPPHNQNSTPPITGPERPPGTLIRVTLTAPLPSDITDLAAQVRPRRGNPDIWYPAASIVPLDEEADQGAGPSGLEITASRTFLVHVPPYAHPVHAPDTPGPQAASGTEQPGERLILEGTSGLRLTWRTHPDPTSVTSSTDASHQHVTAPVPIADPHQVTQRPPAPGPDRPLRTKTTEDLYDDTETLAYLHADLLDVAAQIKRAQGPSPSSPDGPSTVASRRSTDHDGPADTVGRFGAATVSGDWADDPDTALDPALTSSADWQIIQTHMRDRFGAHLAAYLLALTGEDLTRTLSAVEQAADTISAANESWADRLTNDTDDTDLADDTAEDLAGDLPETTSDHPDAADRADDTGPNQEHGPDGDPTARRTGLPASDLPDYTHLPARDRRQRQRALASVCEAAPSLPLHYRLIVTRWLIDSWAAGLWPADDTDALTLISDALTHIQPGHTQPGHTQPGHTQSGHTQSGHTQSGHTQSGHTQSGTATTGSETTAPAWVDTPAPEILTRAASMTLVALTAVRDRANTLDRTDRPNQTWTTLAQRHRDHVLDADDDVISTLISKVRNRYGYPLDVSHAHTVWDLLTDTTPSRTGFIEALRSGRDDQPLDVTAVREDYLALSHAPSDAPSDAPRIRTDPEEIALWVADMASSHASPASEPSGDKPYETPAGAPGHSALPIAVHVTCRHLDPDKPPQWCLVLWADPDLVVVHNKVAGRVRWRHQRHNGTSRVVSPTTAALGEGAGTWRRIVPSGPKHAPTAESADILARHGLAAPGYDPDNSDPSRGPEDPAAWLSTPTKSRTGP